MPTRRRALAMLSASAATMLAAPSPVRAQSWPDRPLRLIVPFAPGGFNDILGRYIAAGIAPGLGQSVVVENRPGGGGVIGSEAGARAAPDGYSLLIASFPHVVNAALHARLPYHPVNDFEAVCLMASNPNVLVVHPSVPANSVQDLVALVRANPGRYSYASNSVGGSSHLGMEMFKAAAGGLDIVHVSYRGSAPAATDLLAGTVQMTIDNLVFQMPFIRDGRVKALGVTSRARTPILPQAPTIAESGYPGFEVAPWYMILVPVRTPAAIVQRLNAEIMKVLRAPDAEQKLTGADILGTTPAEAAAHLRTEFEKWTTVARRIGIRAE